jgi:hypothetical protein
LLLSTLALEKRLDGAFQVDDVQVFGIKSVNQEGKTENI